MSAVLKWLKPKSKSGIEWLDASWSRRSLIVHQRPSLQASCRFYRSSVRRHVAHPCHLYRCFHRRVVSLGFGAVAHTRWRDSLGHASRQPDRWLFDRRVHRRVSRHAATGPDVAFVVDHWLFGRANNLFDVFSRGGWFFNGRALRLGAGDSYRTRGGLIVNDHTRHQGRYIFNS